MIASVFENLNKICRYPLLVPLIVVRASVKFWEIVFGSESVDSPLFPISECCSELTQGYISGRHKYKQVRVADRPNLPAQQKTVTAILQINQTQTIETSHYITAIQITSLES